MTLSCTIVAPPTHNVEVCTYTQESSPHPQCWRLYIMHESRPPHPQRWRLYIIHKSRPPPPTTLTSVYHAQESFPPPTTLMSVHHAQESILLPCPFYYLVPVSNTEILVHYARKKFSYCLNPKHSDTKKKCCINYPKIWTLWYYCNGVMTKRCIHSSTHYSPVLIAALGAVWSRSTLFAQ